MASAVCVCKAHDACVCALAELAEPRALLGQFVHALREQAWDACIAARAQRRQWQPEVVALGQAAAQIHGVGGRDAERAVVACRRPDAAPRGLIGARIRWLVSRAGSPPCYFLAAEDGVAEQHQQQGCRGRPMSLHRQADFYAPTASRQVQHDREVPAQALRLRHGSGRIVCSRIAMQQDGDAALGEAVEQIHSLVRRQYWRSVWKFAEGIAGRSCLRRGALHQVRLSPPAPARSAPHAVVRCVQHR